ncbi:hypothetical protein IV203_035102 [Nitzschia inconspicua]|uniref:Uncharacterized protein n=1 Tax=Nitzschia inconspicua TaxID=303405 RepID=A0A9K3LCW6_9STRA|nr:hypothetical protein IV203_006663 [Nitzschia inconspicua]KAG7360004.1 hypothetical protein IV203_035102 [Nitzschia inconspicua]
MFLCRASTSVLLVASIARSLERSSFYLRAFSEFQRDLEKADRVIESDTQSNFGYRVEGEPYWTANSKWRYEDENDQCERYIRILYDPPCNRGFDTHDVTYRIDPSKKGWRIGWCKRCHTRFNENESPKGKSPNPAPCRLMYLLKDKSTGEMSLMDMDYGEQ